MLITSVFLLFVLVGGGDGAVLLRYRFFIIYNTMKNKRKMRETRVVPRAVVPLVNGESAHCGDGRAAVNVRECEQSLCVTGVPATVGSVAAGERLLTVLGDQLVTCRGRTVLLDGTHAVEADSDIVGAHVIGRLVVVVCQQGLLYLLPDGVGGWQVMDPADAVPQLSIGATVSTVSADIAAVDFVSPYTHWRAPLADADRDTLAGLLRTAWNALNADSRADGYRTAPVLVRWAVRLVDGSYLWMSDPVRVGDETLANADRIAATVNSSNDGFTGTQATTMTLNRYLLNVSIVRGIPAAWQPLVAGIDVLVTDEAQLLSSSRTLDYRCLTRTVGTREYVLEMGLSRRSAMAVTQQLAASRWTLVATAPATAQAGSADFAPPVEAVSLSASQCSALATPLKMTGVVCSTAAGGRLFCCTAAGDVVESAPGNALVEAHRRSVMGAVPLAMAVVTRPLYSSGFGRYPVYVFSDDGIYAIPQGATGRLGEARLVDRTVLKATIAPVEGGGDVWFVSRHGHLCRLSGSRLAVCQRGVDYRDMAWCNAHEELWLLPQQGNAVVMMRSGRLSERTVAARQLYSDARHALAVTPAGEVLDMEQEQPSPMPVSWLSQPVAVDALMGEAVNRVVWHVSGDDVSLTLRATGQRGIMAHEVAVSEMTVTGAVNQPLATPTMARQVRTLSLALAGTARTGTLLLPALFYTSINRQKNHERYII